MIRTKEDYIVNKCEDTTKEIADYLPEFAEANKERIAEGKIKFFYEPWAGEAGVVIDLETLETLYIDTRN